MSHSIHFCTHFFFLLENVQCNELLVWYEASVFCYSVDTGTSLDPLGYIDVALCH